MNNNISALVDKVAVLRENVNNFTAPSRLESVTDPMFLCIYIIWNQCSVQITVVAKFINKLVYL